MYRKYMSGNENPPPKLLDSVFCFLYGTQADHIGNATHLSPHPLLCPPMGTHSGRGTHNSHHCKSVLCRKGRGGRERGGEGKEGEERERGGEGRGGRERGGEGGRGEGRGGEGREKEITMPGN